MKLSSPRNETGAVNPTLVLVTSVIMLGIAALAWEWHLSHPAPYKGDISAHHHHHHHGDGKGHHSGDDGSR